MDQMRTGLYWLLAVPVILVALVAVPGSARPPKGDAKTDEAKEAIAKNAEAFIEVFHKGDAKALAAFWTEDGDYTDQHGHHMKGRAAIEKAFEGYFSDNKGFKLRINSDSLRFVTPDVAIEDGITEVIPANEGPPSRARYTLVHVQKDGKWLLSSVRDAVYVPATNFDHLRGLEWTIGAWAEEGGNGEVTRKAFSWSENQGFVVGTYSTAFRSIVLSGGTQWIGWDPLDKRVRSWMFDHNGGFGEGSWTKDGNKWVSKTSGVWQDGNKVTATNILTYVDADTMTWQSKDRTINGKPLPDIKEIKMKRQK
jgi:uncharacterized protein (TIGR02246 family)